MEHAPERTVDPEDLIYRFLRARDGVNELARFLTQRDRAVFGELHLDLPPLTPRELGFLRCTSWLYLHYYEAGKTNVLFLESKFDAFGIDPLQDIRQHRERIRQLRTYWQHNLLSFNERDAALADACRSWYGRICGTQRPVIEEHWEICLSRLLEEALQYIECIEACVRHIELDESRRTILVEWESRLAHTWDVAEFDRVIEIVARDFGRPDLDVVKFRNRYLDRWREGLELLAAPVDFEREVRKKVEYSLVSDVMASLPITGTDIMRELRLPPGPLIGRLLKRALALYEEAPCDGEQLLRRLAGDSIIRGV